LRRRSTSSRSTNPHATKFNLHILAAVAEFERDTISKRTTEALAAAKAKGKVLGNYARIAKAKAKATAVRAKSVRPAIESVVGLLCDAAAADLNRRGPMTASGKPWFAMSVIRARHHLGL
jgi:DNA invertase Pin-like site-specific DNA recombinase